MSKNLYGSDANQVPTNADLGDLAYQSVIEGRWTPTFSGSSNQTVTTTDEEGYFTVFGKFVFCTFKATVTTAYNEGFYLQWSGAPFATTDTNTSFFAEQPIISADEGVVQITQNRVYISPNATSDTIQGSFYYIKGIIGD
jgi:hypothetical protein